MSEKVKGRIDSILLHYNSLPCGTDTCSREAVRPGQRLRKKKFSVDRSRGCRYVT